MKRDSDRERRPTRSLLVVRNTFEHDARVLRAAKVMQGLGHEVTVLAVRGGGDRGGEQWREGIRVVRVGPRSLRARRAYRAIDRALARAPGAPGPGGGEPEAAPGDRDATGRGPAGAGPLSPARSLLRRLVRWVTTLDFYLRGARELARLGPDLVQCNDYNTMWLGVAARVLCGSAVVYDSHEIWADRNLRPEARWWLLSCEALFVRVADAVVMTSPAHADVLASRYRVERPLVVRNIPEDRPALPALAERGRDGGPATAIYVGGVLRHRGIEQSIAALAQLDGVRLRLLGPVAADYRAELEAAARSAGVAERVEFAEPVPPGEVVERLAAADVGLALFQPVCLSHRLVLPNKLFEYVLAGLPVVGSDLPMISAFVAEHGVGAAVDPAQPAAIAAALAEVVRPERNAELRAAALRAREALDWRKERELLASVYREALAGRD